MRDGPSDNLAAETAYLFRHALLRDAAYELQPPTDRARLHALALQLIELLHGGPAPDPGPPAFGGLKPPAAHATDAVSLDLARHAELAAGADARYEQSAALYLHRAAALAHTSFRFREAAGLWRRLASRLTGVTRLAAIFRQGEAAQDAGLAAEASASFGHVMQAARDADNPMVEGLALSGLATVMLAQGNLADAEPDMRRAIELLRSCDEPRALAKALSNLANLLGHSGRVEEAESAWGTALELLNAADDIEATAAVLNNLAGLFNGRGEVARAEELYMRALEIHREHGRPHSVALVRLNLANLYSHTGREEQAETMLRDVLEVTRKVGNLRLEGGARSNLAAVLANTGQYAEAETLLQQATAIYRELADRRMEAVALAAMMSIYQNSRRYSMALEVGRRALEISRQQGVPATESVLLYNLASVAVDEKRYDEALGQFEQAIAIQRAIRRRESLGNTLCNYMHALLCVGRLEDARRAWLEGSTLLYEVGDTRALKQKTRTMEQLCAARGIQPFPVVSGADD